jgi:DNA-binding NtrC family response regulator
MADDLLQSLPQSAAMTTSEQSGILLIEDDDDLRHEIEGFLSRRNLRVFACASLAEAREVLKSIQPSAVISDIGLPDGDGLDFFASMAGAFPECRWILMSGSHDLDRVDALLKGLSGLRPPTVVEKPFPLRVLRELLD